MVKSYLLQAIIRQIKTPLNGYIHRMMYIILGFLLGVGVVAYLTLNGIDIKDSIKLVSSLLIVISIILASAQFLYNRQWNQKDAAIKGLYTSNKKTTELNSKLNRYLDTNYKIEHNEPLDIVDIHNKMGVFLDNGKFVFHGDETQESIKHIQSKYKNYAQEFDDKIKGREIESLIKDILNEYEYISTACMKGIFDKDIVMSLKAAGIVRTFNLFSNYIYHVRYDKRHNYGDRMYSNFEEFATEISNSLYKDDKYSQYRIRKPTKSEYITPFTLH